MPFLGCRMITLTLEHGVSQDSVFGFVQYAGLLCQQCNLIPEIREACRIGKAALSLLQNFDSSDLVPKVYFCYFGFVAVHTESLKLCTSKLRMGFEGNNVAFHTCLLPLKLLSCHIILNVHNSWNIIRRFCNICIL